MDLEHGRPGRGSPGGHGSLAHDEPPRVLEVTCLDTYGSLSAVVVSPEGQRLLVSAPTYSWPGRQGGGFGVLNGYCHWRQFCRLDQVLALPLSDDNAGELLSLAEQFNVGRYWYGDRGRPGPCFWDLWNYLGDRRHLPMPLTPWRGGPQPPVGLGSAALKYLKLGPDKGLALEVDYLGRQVLMLPPERHLEAPPAIQAAKNGLDLLALPANLAEASHPASWLARLQPRNLVIYGGDAGNERPKAPCLITREGTVSAYLSETGVSVRQWGR